MCPYFLASDPFNIFMGSVLAGFIIGIQELGILYIPTAFPVCLSACHYFDSFVQTECFGHMIDCFDNFCTDKSLYHMISRYLLIKPGYKWRSLFFIETSPAFTSSQNKDAEVGADKISPPPYVTQGRNYDSVSNSERIYIFTR